MTLPSGRTVTVAAAAKSGEAPAAVLRVNALATFSMRWLLPRLSRFRDERPDIEVRLTTSNDPIDALADIAVAVNSSVENIGARRLQTVMERVLDEISFAAPDRNGETIRIDAEYVQQHVGDLAKNADLSRFIL